LTNKARRQGSFGKGVIVGGVIVGGFLTLAVFAQEVAVKNPYTGKLEAIAEGQRFFAEMGCHHCHGPNGEGGMGPDLTDEVWRYRPTDETLFQIISRGIPGTTMPPWEGKLSPDQIWKIIAFIRSRYKGDPSKILW